MPFHTYFFSVFFGLCVSLSFNMVHIVLFTESICAATTVAATAITKHPHGIWQYGKAFGDALY